MRLFSPFLCFGVALLSACASSVVYQTPKAEAPAQFGAPLPVAMQEAKARDLLQWWRQFDEPLVAELVAAAQLHSPGLGQARARLAQARASVASARAFSFFQVDLSGKAVRSKIGALSDSTSVNGDSSWEVDLFGGNASRNDAASARMAARAAQLFQFQVSLAAEVATSLVSYRSCRNNTLLQEQDLASRQQTGQLTQLKVQAGFNAPQDASLLQAALADARQRLIAQRAECDLEIKALVALTGWSEVALRSRLAKLDGSEKLPQPAQLVVQSIPAQVLAQRPDIASAERDVAAAFADINSAEAARWPRLSLTGGIGIGSVRADGQSSHSTSWSFGPSLSLPIFNAGRLAADVDAARARYDESYQTYRAQVIAAVQEIETSLVRLDAGNRRFDDAAQAVTHYDKFLAASQAQYNAGSGSLLDLEDARRSLLAARQNQLNVQRERILAWIALYKALGGGWSAQQAESAARPE